MKRAMKDQCAGPCLREGEETASVIEPGGVAPMCAEPETAADDPFSTFFEWDSPADMEAYAGL